MFREFPALTERLAEVHKRLEPGWTSDVPLRKDELLVVLEALKFYGAHYGMLLQILEERERGAHFRQT